MLFLLTPFKLHTVPRCTMGLITRLTACHWHRIHVFPALDWCCWLTDFMCFSIQSVLPGGPFILKGFFWWAEWCGSIESYVINHPWVRSIQETEDDTDWWRMMLMMAEERNYSMSLSCSYLKIWVCYDGNLSTEQILGPSSSQIVKPRSRCFTVLDISLRHRGPHTDSQGLPYLDAQTSSYRHHKSRGPHNFRSLIVEFRLSHNSKIVTMYRSHPVNVNVLTVCVKTPGINWWLETLQHWLKFNFS